MAGWTMEDGHVTEIKLYPISLGMTEKRPQKGVPVLTGDENVLSYLAELSKPYGTEMEIKDGVGTSDFKGDRKSKVLSEIDRDREELEENDRNRYNEYEDSAPV